MKGYTKFTDDVLIQMLANATTTACQALGHTKAFNNEWAVKRIKQEVINRNLTVPDRDELLQKGIFNGPGAY